MAVAAVGVFFISVCLFNEAIIVATKVIYLWYNGSSSLHVNIVLESYISYRG